jgi:hypothetical protein
MDDAVLESAPAGRRGSEAVGDLVVEEAGLGGPCAAIRLLDQGDHAATGTPRGVHDRRSLGSGTTAGDHDDDVPAGRELLVAGEVVRGQRVQGRRHAAALVVGAHRENTHHAREFVAVADHAQTRRRRIGTHIRDGLEDPRESSATGQVAPRSPE